MALTNAERVGKGLDALKTGLRPFVERELTAAHGKYWIIEVTANWQGDLRRTEDNEPHLDAALEEQRRAARRDCGWPEPDHVAS